MPLTTKREAAAVGLWLWEVKSNLDVSLWVTTETKNSARAARKGERAGRAYAKKKGRTFQGITNLGQHGYIDA